MDLLSTKSPKALLWSDLENVAIFFDCGSFDWINLMKVYDGCVLNEIIVAWDEGMMLCIGY